MCALRIEYIGLGTSSNVLFQKPIEKGRVEIRFKNRGIKVISEAKL